MSVFTYKQASEEFAKARDKAKGKLLADNTRLVARAGYFAIVYHKTEIVKIYPNDTYELNSGGWHTYSTKERLNAFSPVNLWANKGLWYFNNNVFQDGVKVDSKGKPIDKVESVESIEGKKNALDKAVSSYIKRFCEHLKKHGLKDPDAGDCWLCGLLNKAGDYTNVGHLISHMEEDYFVSRLLFEAVSEHVRGRSWQSALPDNEAKEVIRYRWYIMKTNEHYRSREASVALRRYFTNRKSELMKVFDPEAFAKMRKERLAEAKHMQVKT